MGRGGAAGESVIHGGRRLLAAAVSGLATRLQLTGWVEDWAEARSAALVEPYPEPTSLSLSLPRDHVPESQPTAMPGRSPQAHPRPKLTYIRTRTPGTRRSSHRWT